MTHCDYGLSQDFLQYNCQKYIVAKDDGSVLFNIDKIQHKCFWYGKKGNRGCEKSVHGISVDNELNSYFKKSYSIYLGSRFLCNSCLQID